MSCWIGTILTILTIFTLLSVTSSAIVEIEDGKLEGTVMQSRRGKSIDAFLKIPFAEPPIGSLRFRPPIQNKKWDGILDARSYGTACMQYWGDGWSEDCLQLNVFTRNLNRSDLKPVIVYIHGGAFVSGSANVYHPDYLLDRDIVLVTVNYRLGPFGFLATGTKDITGNMGLKDQALALKWVQRNIKKFGGDPNLVTITGLSAGAFSVTSHLASDMSKGLFHRAIAMSGAITYQTGLESNNLEKTKQMASEINCPTDINGMIKCLQQKSAKEIVMASHKEYYGCLVLDWFPVVEPDFEQERFFVDQPNQLFKEGNFAKVPVIIGITADEFIWPVHDLLNNFKAVSELNNNFDEIASKCFFFKGNGKQSTAEISKILKDHYLPFDKIGKGSFNSLQHLCADGSIGYSVHRFVHYVSHHSDVYYYKFSYVGKISSYRQHKKPYGVHHGDDDHYLFPAYGPNVINLTDSEYFMVERLTRIWEQFAIKGNPHSRKDEYLSDMIWPTHDLEDEFFLDIGTNMLEKHGLYLERYLIWDRLDESTYLTWPKPNLYVVKKLLRYFFNY